MTDPADADPPGVEPAGVEPAGTDPTGAGPRGRKWRRALGELGVTIVVTVLVASLVRTFALQPFWIPSASMTPTFGVYDRILVQKAFFTWHDAREGDIVVFSHPPLDNCPGPEEDDLVKARHRAAGSDDLFVGQQHLRKRAAASRALPATVRPARAADSEQPAPLPGAARRVLCAGRQPSGLNATAGTGARSKARASSAKSC